MQINKKSKSIFTDEVYKLQIILDSKNKYISSLEEALLRRRNLFTSLESSIISTGFPSISERALRLKRLMTNANEEFKNDNDKDFWMEQYIKLISNPINNV